MPKYFLALLFTIAFFVGGAQQHTISLGIYTGITSSYTYDQGIIQDQRYQNRYNVKLAPIGLTYGIDFEDFGFLFSPGITTLGQNFYVINTTGGQVGVRKINLQYLTLPAGCKVRLIDLSFFRVSVLGSVSPAFLLNGKETVSHDEAKLKFPAEIVPPVLPPSYLIEYDGVLSPAVNNYSMLQKDDFNTFQLFVGAGIRSDWDASDHWRVSFDFRVNYGLLEPRTDAYLTKLNSFQTLYDMPGSRKDMFVEFTIGAARFLEIEKKETKKKKPINGSRRKYRR